MNRKEFITKCTYACMDGLLVPSLLQSCSSLNLIQTNEVDAKIEGSDLLVPLASFGDNENKKLYIVARHPDLRYPICVYRFSETEYTALLMACTHQGTELQVFGEKLECPAHGSEFNNQGAVENGPAEESLRSFPIQIEAEVLKISLKAVS